MKNMMLVAVMGMVTGAIVAADAVNQQHALERLKCEQFTFPSKAAIENAVGLDPADEFNFFTEQMCQLADAQGTIGSLLENVLSVSGFGFRCLNPFCRGKVESAGGLINIFFGALPEEKRRMIVRAIVGEFPEGELPHERQGRFVFRCAQLLVSTGALPDQKRD